MATRKRLADLIACLDATTRPSQQGMGRLEAPAPSLPCASSAGPGHWPAHRSCASVCAQIAKSCYKSRF